MANAAVSDCCCGDSETCTSYGTQYADVSLPVKLTPSASIGDVTTQCCGEPNITMRVCPCGKGCNIVITQTLSMTIPIEYGSTVETGDICVICRQPPSGCQG